VYGDVLVWNASYTMNENLNENKDEYSEYTLALLASFFHIDESICVKYHICITSEKWNYINLYIRYVSKEYMYIIDIYQRRKIFL